MGVGGDDGAAYPTTASTGGAENTKRVTRASLRWSLLASVECQFCQLGFLGFATFSHTDFTAS